MGVIVKDNDSKFLTFVKGSPEKIKLMSINSSIPNDFNEKL